MPRNFPPPKWEMGGHLDRSKANKRNWILVWEDGFCDFSRSWSQETKRSSNAFDSTSPCISTKETNSLHPELFFKMSHEVYNYGEGLMGKVSADNGYKWVYRDPPEHTDRIVPFWQTSIDPQPRTWDAQFKSGIQTISVIAVREGVVQLGSPEKVQEDLNFVTQLQRKFNSLHIDFSVLVTLPQCQNSASSTQVESSERKMRRHVRPENTDDELPERRLERRLSWSGSVNDTRRGCDNAGICSSSSSSKPTSVQVTSHLFPDAKPAVSMMPSMASLQSLLSKLPSVTRSAAKNTPESSTPSFQTPIHTRSLSAHIPSSWAPPRLSCATTPTQWPETATAALDWRDTQSVAANDVGDDRVSRSPSVDQNAGDGGFEADESFMRGSVTDLGDLPTEDTFATYLDDLIHGSKKYL